MSPFAALGQMLGAKGDLGSVAFAAGESALAPERADQVQKVAQALVDRPQMLVGVRGAAGGADASAFGHRVRMSRLRASDAEMRTLALARASAVKEALLARGVEEARFFSLEPAVTPDAADAPYQLQLDVR